MKDEMPTTVLVERMGEAIRELNRSSEHGLSEEVFAEVLLASWV